MRWLRDPDASLKCSSDVEAGTVSGRQGSFWSCLIGVIGAYPCHRQGIRNSMQYFFGQRRVLVPLGRAAAATRSDVGKVA
jgi:hypothetical protein